MCRRLIAANPDRMAGCSASARLRRSAAATLRISTRSVWRFFTAIIIPAATIMPAAARSVRWSARIAATARSVRWSAWIAATAALPRISADAFASLRRPFGRSCASHENTLLSLVWYILRRSRYSGSGFSKIPETSSSLR